MSGVVGLGVVRLGGRAILDGWLRAFGGVGLVVGRGSLCDNGR